MKPPSPEPDRGIAREAFRQWREAQPTGRHERVDGRIVAMAPERGARLRVKGAAYTALDRAIAAAKVDCQALPDGATVQTGDSDHAPDALVNRATPNLVIVVEVLSPGTATTDTGGKLAEYFRVPSIAHDLIVHPVRRMVTHHRRNGSGIETSIVVNGPISLDPPEIFMPIKEIYEG